MTAGIEQFQTYAPDQYAGATPNWKRRMLAAQLLQQQAQTGDKVYGTGLGSMKLLASALGGWMEGKEEKKVADQVAEADRLMPLPSSNGTTAPVKTVPDAPQPAVSTSGGKAVTNYDPKNPPDFLDLIGGAEGTDKGRGYNETLAYGKFAGGPQDLENMPVSQVRQLQAQMLQHPENTFNSSAAGRGQIVGKTLQGLIDQGVVKPDELYNKDVQDRAIDHLARSRGADAAGLRNEWEGLRRVPEDVIVASYNKRYGAKQPTQTAGEVPTDVSSADPNFVPSMQGNKVRPDIAGAMAPMMPPKTEPVPGPSMAPPDLTSVAIDSATGKPIPANAARLDTSAIDRAHPRPQAAPQVPTQAPPAPQQMAQAQSQPRPQTPTAVSQTPLGATPEEIAFARVIVRNQALGIPVSAIQVAKANAILNPVLKKLNDGTLYDERSGRFFEAPKQPYTIAPGAQRRGKNDELLAENVPPPEQPLNDAERAGFKVPEGQAAGRMGGKIHYGPAGPNINVNTGDTVGNQEMMKRGIQGFDDAHAEAKAATRRIAQYGEIAKAMEGFKPGASAETRLTAKRWLKDAGFIGDEGVSDAETFDRIVKQLQINAQPKGQGPVSNFERELFGKAVINMGNSPEAIAKAIDISKRLDEYDIRVAKIYRDNARKNGGKPNYLDVMDEVAALGSPMRQDEVTALQNLLDRGGKPAPSGTPVPAAQAPASTTTPAEMSGYKIRRLN